MLGILFVLIFLFEFDLLWLRPNIAQHLAIAKQCATQEKHVKVRRMMLTPHKMYQFFSPHQNVALTPPLKQQYR